jgi:hypothetical protein
VFAELPASITQQGMLLAIASVWSFSSPTPVGRNFSDRVTASVMHHDLLPDGCMGRYGVRLL